MKYNIQIRWRVIIGLLLLLELISHLPGGGEWYVRTVYPRLSYGLSAISSAIPIALDDIAIALTLCFLAFLLVQAVRLRTKRYLWRILELLLWAHIWFYTAWGLTYSRQHFYVRAGVESASFSKERFLHFLQCYTTALNDSYVAFLDPLPESEVAAEVKQGYRALDPSLGLCQPSDQLRAKKMLFPSLMSGVGVLGYIGPFFIEYNLNPDLLPVQYPSTYAHELAHVLGVSNEAEANFYAYRICTASSNPTIRYSGYFSLLGHVLVNAKRLLTTEEFETWKAEIRPEVRAMYNDEVAYWHARYSPLMGKIQDKVYDLYLKWNGIPTGKESYSEVVYLVISMENSRIIHQ